MHQQLDHASQLYLTRVVLVREGRYFMLKGVVMEIVGFNPNESVDFVFARKTHGVGRRAFGVLIAERTLGACSLCGDAVGAGLERGGQVNIRWD